MQAEHHSSGAPASLEQARPSAPHATIPRLRALVDDVLRTAFVRTRDDRSLDQPTMGPDPMRELCAVARANDLRPEAVILAIKDGWRRFPESHVQSRLESEATVAVIITRCIKEYYRP